MFSYGLFAMGLGDISVNSFLNQPLSADIELIDVGNTRLSEIKVSLASSEDFERVGLERSYSLALLTLTVEKHKNGKAFIKVSSVEGIRDPFMELLVDLAWADGQVYRSYTVFLDPPNYQLTMVKAQLHKMIKQQSGVDNKEPGVIDKTVYSTVERMPGKSTSDSLGLIVYGPTLPNETIWQISQRYKSDDFLLQQMILAIVGINPEVFTDGNLNGLKNGSRLKIPDSSLVKQVSSELSISEVLAHDKAWQTKGSIEHTLMPPYINTKAPEDVNKSMKGELRSYIPVFPSQLSGISSNKNPDPVPLFTTFSSFISGKDGAASEAELDVNDTVLAKEVKLQSDIDIATAAINSIRQSNGMLVEQLKRLQTSNKQLQKQLMESKRHIQRLHHKIHNLMIQKRTTGQATHQSTHVEKKRLFPWIILLFELSIVVGVFIWWLWGRFKSKAGAVDLLSMNPTPSSEAVNDTSENRVVLPEAPEMKDLVSHQKAEKTDTKEPKMVKAPLDGKSNFDLPADDLEYQNGMISSEKSSLINDKVSFPEEKVSVVKPNVGPINPSEGQSISNEPERSDEGYLIEFEPGIIEVHEEEAILEKKVETKGEGIPKEPEITEKKDESNIDFVSNSVHEISDLETSNPVKSGAALETLLALGKTYIGMDDIEAARQSLQEVLEFGSESQQKEAKQLLDALNKKQ
jgi:pilus assembly protein FimV